MSDRRIVADYYVLKALPSAVSTVTYWGWVRCVRFDDGSGYEVWPAL